MGVYLYLKAKSEAQEYAAIGSTIEAREKAREIWDRYRPILDDQMREDWSEQYAAMEAEFDAEPAVRIAHEYAFHGLGKVQCWSLLTPYVPHFERSKSGRLYPAPFGSTKRLDVTLQAVAAQQATGRISSALAARVADALRSGLASGLCWG